MSSLGGGMYAMRSIVNPSRSTPPAEPLGPTRSSTDRQVLWFGLLAFGLTWAAWLPLVARHEGWGLRVRAHTFTSSEGLAQPWPHS